MNLSLVINLFRKRINPVRKGGALNPTLNKGMNIFFFIPTINGKAFYGVKFKSILPQ